MSTTISRASKRLRVVAPPPSSGWVCNSCRRSFATTQRLGERVQQERARLEEQQRIEDKTTHFGFETVAESLKASRVANVFSSVASSYDTMNDLMSLGIHRIWKDGFVRGLNPGIRPTPSSSSAGPQRILDIAGGTGDIALRMLDHATAINKDTTAHVTVSDINPEMLAEGRKRLSATPYAAAGRVDFLEANAEDLHTIPDASIDLYTVAFGIRNFTHKEKALREAHRVLKPGGVFACLEFAPNLSNPLFNAVYKRWSFSAIPLIGQIVASDRDSYQYLVESIERFPKQEVFASMIRDAGFVVPGVGREGGRGEVESLEGGWEDLSFGIAAVHKGVKPV